MSLCTLDPVKYESVLRRQWLAHAQTVIRDGGDEAWFIGEELFELLMSTQVEPLWCEVGALLHQFMQSLSGDDFECFVEAALVEADHQQPTQRSWRGRSRRYRKPDPAWRLRPVCSIPYVRDALLARLSHERSRARVAALKALAPLVVRHRDEKRDAEVEAAIMAAIEDGAEHVSSTAIEVLRPVAHIPEVRDRLLAMMKAGNRLPNCVERALGRTLRAIADDREVQQTMLSLLADGGQYDAAVALSGAPDSPWLREQLIALVHAHDTEAVRIWQAFVPCASDEAIAATFRAWLGHPDAYVVQSALRVVGGDESRASRAAVLATLQHPVCWVRATALEQLRPHVLVPEVHDALCDLLRNADTDTMLRLDVLKALGGAIEVPQIRRLIVTYLDDPSPVMAVTAAQALGRIGPDREAWRVLEPHVTARGRIYTEGYGRWVDPLERLGQLPQLPEARDLLGAILEDSCFVRERLELVRALRVATPTEPIADILAVLVMHEGPMLATAAYETLLYWVTGTQDVSA